MTTSNACHLCGEEANIFDRDGGWCRAHWDEAEAATRAEEKRLTEEAGGPWLHLCPSATQGTFTAARSSLRSPGVKVREQTMTDERPTFYVLVCEVCTPRLPMPFSSPDERGSWAAKHRAATGHDRSRRTAHRPARTRR